MITFFTIPKPFEGSHRRDPAERARVVAARGAGCAGASCSARHRTGSTSSTSPEIARNEHGTPLLDDAFRIAEGRARHPIMSFVNADILLPPSLGRARSRQQLDTANGSSSWASAGTCKSTRRSSPTSIAWDSRGSQARSGRDRLLRLLPRPVRRPAAVRDRPHGVRQLARLARTRPRRDRRRRDLDGARAASGSFVRARRQPRRGAREPGRAREPAAPGRRPRAALLPLRRHAPAHRGDGCCRIRSVSRMLGETVRRGWAKLGYTVGFRA